MSSGSCTTHPYSFTVHYSHRTYRSLSQIMVSMLFADVVGYSKLKNEQIVHFVNNYLTMVILTHACTFVHTCTHQYTQYVRTCIHHHMHYPASIYQEKNVSTLACISIQPRSFVSNITARTALRQSSIPTWMQVSKLIKYMAKSRGVEPLIKNTWGDAVSSR